MPHDKIEYADIVAGLLLVRPSLFMHFLGGQRTPERTIVCRGQMHV
jgi:hypothetical protein